jgi:uncharacterized protein (DUF2225 family)
MVKEINCPVCWKIFPEEKMLSGMGIHHEIDTLI